LTRHQASLSFPPEFPFLVPLLFSINWDDKKPAGSDSHSIACLTNITPFLK